MTPIDRFERHLPDRLAELANPQVPDYLNDLLAQTARSRQRPAWTLLERWIPMALLTQSGARVRPLRQTWQLLVVLAVSLALVAGLAVAGARILLPQPPDQGFNSLVTVPTLELSDTWDANAITGLDGPSGMDLGPDGNLYVVNAAKNEILVIDGSGSVVRRWGTAGSGEGQFEFIANPGDPYSAIGGVGVGPDGSVYVADAVNDRVQQFTSTGTFIRQWGGFGPANGQFLHPFDLAVGPDGNVFVVDDRRADIQAFTSDGTWLAVVGGRGSGVGQLQDTAGIDVNHAGDILNADYGNHRIQAWDAVGDHQWSTATSTQPMDVAAADDGSVFVAHDRGVVMMDSERSVLATWAPDAGGDDVHSVTVAPDGNLYVSSLASDVIYRLQVVQRQVEATPGPSPELDASASPMASAPQGTGIAPRPSLTTFVSDAAFPVPFTLALPERWSANGSGRGYVDTVLTRDTTATPAYVTVFIPTNAFTDPCQATDGPMAPPVGPSVDDLTVALTTAVGMRSGPVQDVTVDSFRGKEFLLDNNIDITTCSDDPWLPQWTFDAANSGPVEEASSSGLAGGEQRIVILDVNGTRVLILGWTLNSRLDEVAETYQVMDSIDFQ